jgi:hypothetical protein
VLGRVCRGWVRARHMIMKVSEVFVIGVWRARGGIVAAEAGRRELAAAIEAGLLTARPASRARTVTAR